KVLRCIEGPFAFLHWCPVRQRLFCMRDSIGRRSLCVLAERGSAPSLFSTITVTSVVPDEVEDRSMEKMASAESSNSRGAARTTMNENDHLQKKQYYAELPCGVPVVFRRIPGSGGLFLCEDEGLSKALAQQDEAG
ncbi:unnamed protein product, partial [Amoebophrya sp. A25]